MGIKPDSRSASIEEWYEPIINNILTRMLFFASGRYIISMTQNDTYWMYDLEFLLWKIILLDFPFMPDNSYGNWRVNLSSFRRSYLVSGAHFIYIYICLSSLQILRNFFILNIGNLQRLLFELPWQILFFSQTMDFFLQNHNKKSSIVCCPLDIVIINTDILQRTCSG